MKFLPHAPSVTSLRFKYQEVPRQEYETLSANPPRAYEEVMVEIRQIGDVLEQEGGYEDMPGIGLLLLELKVDHPKAPITPGEQAVIDDLTNYFIVNDVQNSLAGFNN